jgi:hypothetical protein
LGQASKKSFEVREFHPKGQSDPTKQCCGPDDKLVFQGRPLEKKYK